MEVEACIAEKNESQSFSENKSLFTFVFVFVFALTFIYVCKISNFIYKIGNFLKSTTSDDSNIWNNKQWLCHCAMYRRIECNIEDPVDNEQKHFNKLSIIHNGNIWLVFALVSSLCGLLPNTNNNKQLWWNYQNNGFYQWWKLIWCCAFVLQAIIRFVWLYPFSCVFWWFVCHSLSHRQLRSVSDYFWPFCNCSQSASSIGLCVQYTLCGWWAIFEQADIKQCSWQYSIETVYIFSTNVIGSEVLELRIKWCVEMSSPLNA